MALTIEQLRSLDDDELVSAVFSECDDAPEAPEGCWLVYLMCIIIEGDIYNGGFAQYFQNSEGEFLDEAIAAYDQFELVDMGNLMREAKTLYSRGHGTVEWTDVPGIDDLDRRFDEIEDLTRAARVKFIRSNPSLFVTA